MTTERPTIGERIAGELKAQGYGGIASGDHHLIFQVADATGIAPQRTGEHPFAYVKRILAAIDRCERFEKRYVRAHFGPYQQSRLVRSYRLKDAGPG